MKVLKVQLGAEGILVGHHPAGVFMGPVTHAGTIRLKVCHLGLIPRPTMLGVILDVNDHVVAVPCKRRPLLSLPSLLFNVHEQPENNQIEERPNDRQSHKDVHKAKRHIEWLLLKGSFRLQGHVIPEPDCSQCYKAVVESLEEGPLFTMRKGCSSNAEGPYAGEEAHGHHVLHGDVRAPHPATLFHPLQKVLDKGVHAFTKALEHDQCQRNAQGGIAHAEGLPSICSWGSMSVTW